MALLKTSGALFVVILKDYFHLQPQIDQKCHSLEVLQPELLMPQAAYRLLLVSLTLQHLPVHKQSLIQQMQRQRILAYESISAG